MSDVYKTEATLSWQPPEEDGGTPVIGYNVERALAGSARWLKITKALIKKLTVTDQVCVVTFCVFRYANIKNEFAK